MLFANEIFLLLASSLSCASIEKAHLKGTPRIQKSLNLNTRYYAHS